MAGSEINDTLVLPVNLSSEPVLTEMENDNIRNSTCTFFTGRTNTGECVNSGLPNTKPQNRGACLVAHMVLDPHVSPHGGLAPREPECLRRL